MNEGTAHGDAQPMNALVDSQTCRWFDWSEARIAHPFCDAGWLFAWTFLPKRDLALFNTANAATQLWEHYLHALGLQTHVALKDAMRVALVQRILSYHERFYTWQGSTPNWRPQYVTYYLKLLLRTV
jgi:aminoglycoside phosphotransferase (APT) family kinase protein